MQSESTIKYAVKPREEQKVKFWRSFKPVVTGKTDEKEPIWFCPHDAISEGAAKLVIDYKKCDGCLICVRECHSGVIKEEEE